MFSFEYIAPFWYQQESQESGFLIRNDRRGNLCIQRRECAVFDQIYGKVSRSPYSLLTKRIRSYYNAILRNINTKKLIRFLSYLSCNLRTNESHSLNKCLSEYANYITTCKNTILKQYHLNNLSNISVWLRFA